MPTITGILLSLTLLVATSLSWAAPKGAPVRDYSFEQVAKNTWVIHGPLGLPNVENQGFMNNPGMVLTGQGVVIIEPGSSVQSGEMVLRMVKEVTDLPVIAVFNTHIHGDHWLGNQAIREAYPDVPIYGHTKMLAMVAAGAGEHGKLRRQEHRPRQMPAIRRAAAKRQPCAAPAPCWPSPSRQRPV